MKFQTRQIHVIDLIFPIALFFVFAASSLAVLLLAANLYGSTTGQIQANDQNRTCLSYIAEKIRQNDSDRAVSIQSIDDTECLALRGNYNGIACTTYIYELDGSLKELFINDGVDISLKNGKTIMEIERLRMEETGDGIFHFASTDKKGNEDSLIISERSEL